MRNGDGLSEESDERRAALEGAIAALDGCLARLERFVRTLSVEEFTGRDHSLVQSGISGSIGSHVRHILDHVEAAASVHDAVAGVDYDQRERGRPSERVPALSAERIVETRNRLSALRGLSPAHPMQVKMMVTPDAPGVTLVSSLARELAFVWHHAVHHCAYIDLLAHHVGVSSRTGVGVAPSTQAYAKSRTASAPVILAGE